MPPERTIEDLEESALAERTVSALEKPDAAAGDRLRRPAEFADFDPLVGLLARLPSPRLETAVDRLLEICREDPARGPVLGEALRSLSDSSLVAVWQRCGPRLFELVAHDGGVLAERLRTILRSLAEQPAELAKRFAMVESGKHHLSGLADRNRLAAWVACREAILGLAEMQQAPSAWSGRPSLRKLEMAAHRMAESIAAAMPARGYPGHLHAARMEQSLRALGSDLLGRDPFLPDLGWPNEALWKKLRWFFERGSWPSMPLRHLASGRRSPNRHAILVGISAAMVLGLLTVTARTALDAGSKRQEPLVLQRRSARSAAPQPALPPPAERNSASPEVAAGGASSGGTTVAGLPQPTPLVLIPIPGEVTIRQTPARELSPPAIASIRLAVGTAGGRAMPQWLEEEWTVGALIVEQADGQARRYVELPSLAAHCDAEVVDGADRVLVRFHFARKLPPQTDLSAPMVAVSCATAEISIQAGSHYDLCFDPARPAIDQLETVVKGEESGWASPHRD